MDVTPKRRALPGGGDPFARAPRQPSDMYRPAILHLVSPPDVPGFRVPGLLPDPSGADPTLTAKEVEWPTAPSAPPGETGADSFRHLVAVVRPGRTGRKALRSAVEAAAPVLVHAHSLRVLELASRDGLTKSVPFVVAPAATELRWTGKSLEPAGTSRQLLATSNVVVAAGPTCHRLLGHWLAEGPPPRMARAGIDPSGWRPDPGQHREQPVDGVRLLWIGPLVERTGLGHALESFARLLPSLPSSRLTVVGCGPREKESRAIAALHGLNAHVEFPGGDGRLVLEESLRRSDVLVHTSHETGDSVAENGAPVDILVAMAGGLPVVSTAHGDATDAVEDGVTGLLVPELDVDALTEATRQLAEDPEQARSMGAAGRELVARRFGARRQAVELEAIYREVLTPETVGAPTGVEAARVTSDETRP